MPNPADRPPAAAEWREVSGSLDAERGGQQDQAMRKPSFHDEMIAKIRSAPVRTIGELVQTYERHFGEIPRPLQQEIFPRLEEWRRRYR